MWCIRLAAEAGLSRAFEKAVSVADTDPLAFIALQDSANSARDRGGAALSSFSMATSVSCSYKRGIARSNGVVTA